MTKRSWNIVADIGGTNARFAVADRHTPALHCVQRYSVAEHAQFADALAHFLADVGRDGHWAALPTAACFALACPVDGDRIRFTNSPWQIDRGELRAQLQQAPVELINDFAAVGYAVTDLEPQQWLDIRAGVPLPTAPIVVLGPGTGLGVCTVVPVAEGFQVLAGEGGHVDFGAIDAVDVQVFEVLRARFGRVSAERILSGSGIESVYTALAQIGGRQAQRSDAADIVAAAIAHSDPLAVETLQLFCRTLGSVAGNLALTLGAKGGVYIAGGIVPRFIEFFRSSGFVERFLAKGRFESYLAEIPLRLITKDDLGLAGAEKKLALLGLSERPL